MSGFNDVGTSGVKSLAIRFWWLILLSTYLRMDSVSVVILVDNCKKIVVFISRHHLIDIVTYILVSNIKIARNFIL